MEECFLRILPIVLGIFINFLLLIQKYIFPTTSKNLYYLIIYFLFSILSFFFIKHLEIEDNIHYYNNPKNSRTIIIGMLFVFIGSIIKNIFNIINSKKIHHEIDLTSFLKLKIKKLIDMENLIAIFTIVFEEIVHRAFLCNLWESINVNNVYSIFIIPFVFGICKVYVIFVEVGSLASKINNFLTQFLFTAVYGWLISFIWVKTHCFITCVIVHLICYIYGYVQIKEIINWRIYYQKIILMVGFLFGFTSLIGVIGFLKTSK